MKDATVRHIEMLCHEREELALLRPTLFKGLRLLVKTVRAGGKILICGNGGSAADAEHIVGELMKGFLLPRPLSQADKNRLTEQLGEAGTRLGEMLQGGIPAVSLVAGVALSTAFANDVAAEFMFAQEVWGLGVKGDLLWGISTSGNSANVNHALRTAKALGLGTLGLTGKGGGEMAALCDVELRVPANETPYVQELHLPVYHALCAALETEIYG